MDIRKISTPINFVLFQLCWFACVMGAANNIKWLGPVLVLATVPTQIYLLTDRYKAETIFVIVCGVAGFFLETFLIFNHVYVPLAQQSVLVCPPWMAALWFNFGMLISLSLSWLKGKYVLAAVLGGLAGPVAYWGGEKLGALVVAEEFVKGYVPLIGVWAFALPFLVYLHCRIVRG